MIRARLVLNRRGHLESFEANGHADLAESGNDIVCAAFTALARSTAKVLHDDPGVVLRGGASEPGNLHFDVESCEDYREPWLEGVQDVFIRGMEDLSREYPERLQIDVVRYGT